MFIWKSAIGLNYFSYFYVRLLLIGGAPSIKSGRILYFSKECREVIWFSAWRCKGHLAVKCNRIWLVRSPDWLIDWLNICDWLKFITSITFFYFIRTVFQLRPKLNTCTSSQAFLEYLFGLNYICYHKIRNTSYRSVTASCLALLCKLEWQCSFVGLGFCCYFYYVKRFWTIGNYKYCILLLLLSFWWEQHEQQQSLFSLFKFYKRALAIH